MNVGNNLYQVSEASGQPIVQNAGTGNTGTLLQSYLETSNVKIVNEMVDMIAANRAYDASVQTANAAKAMVNKALEIGK